MSAYSSPIQKEEVILISSDSESDCAMPSHQPQAATPPQSAPGSPVILSSGPTSPSTPAATKGIINISSGGSYLSSGPSVIPGTPSPRASPVNDSGLGAEGVLDCSFSTVAASPPGSARSISSPDSSIPDYGHPLGCSRCRSPTTLCHRCEEWAEAEWQAELRFRDREAAEEAEAEVQRTAQRLVREEDRQLEEDRRSVELFLAMEAEMAADLAIAAE
ncbi:uncharacterized protein LOC127751041, partial [Frankliniella occidentalis]|uniref:Uncharacterized protein LOC127751041 n=1 Tax=Frankliniella occidentalis TaxID=133901 RepID=A0A9C6X690_FRAOC